MNTTNCMLTFNWSVDEAKLSLDSPLLVTKEFSKDTQFLL